MKLIYVNENGQLAKMVSLEDIALVEENIGCADGWGITITYKQGVKIALQTKEAHKFWVAYNEMITLPKSRSGGLHITEA